MSERGGNADGMDRQTSKRAPMPRERASKNKMSRKETVSTEKKKSLSLSLSFILIDPIFHLLYNKIREESKKGSKHEKR